MLNVTEEIGTKYGIKFGEEKSKILKIGNKLQKEEFHIGEMKIGYTVTNTNTLAISYLTRTRWMTTS